MRTALAGIRSAGANERLLRQRKTARVIRRDGTFRRDAWMQPEAIDRSIPSGLSESPPAGHCRFDGAASGEWC